MAIAWKRAMKPAPMNPSFISSPKIQWLVASGWWLVAENIPGKTRLRGTSYSCYLAMLTPRRRVEKIEMDPGGRATARGPSGVAEGQFRGAHEQPVLAYQVASAI